MVRQATKNVVLKRKRKITPMVQWIQNERNDGRIDEDAMLKAQRSVIDVTAMETPCKY